MEIEEEGGRGKAGESKAEKEYEEFLKDLEEDPELRANVVLYKDAEGTGTTATRSSTDDNTSMVDGEEGDEDEEDPHFQDVTLDELVDEVAGMALDEEDD